MNEEKRLLLKLIEENARYKVFFDLLSTKVIKEDSENRMYVHIEEIKPLVDAFEARNREISVITFDNCEDTAYAGD